MAASLLCVGKVVTSRSPKKTFPSVGVSRPAMHRSRVVFPQPLPPKRKKSSPGAISSETFLSAVTLPNLFVIPAARISSIWRHALISLEKGKFNPT